MTYDLIVIGGGPAGYHGAQLAAEAGLSVLLIEKRGALGGVCLQEGCIPAKTLLHAARLLDLARSGARYGLSSPGAALDLSQVQARKRRIIKTLERGIVSGLEKSGVAMAKGTALVKGKRQADYLVATETESFAGKRILIAAGSLPVVPSLPGLEAGIADGSIVGSREALAWETLPPRLTIVGAGAVGLEFAWYAAALGARVTVVEMLGRIGAALDAELASALQRALEGRGIVFKLDSAVTGFAPGAVFCRGKNGDETIPSEKTILSIGRRPAAAGLGLETVGVKLDGSRIATDVRGMTNINGVYAAGDVTGRALLAHAAYREAEVVVAGLLGKEDRVAYNAMPSVIDTHPEAAVVGETEDTARSKGIDCRTASFSLRLSGRFLIENEGGEGFCKVVVDRRGRKLLGLHLLGDPAGEIVYGAAEWIERGLTLSDIERMVFPHPTVSEIFREAARRMT